MFVFPWGSCSNVEGGKPRGDSVDSVTRAGPSRFSELTASASILRVQRGTMADGSVEFFVALLGEMKIKAANAAEYAERLVAEDYDRELFVEMSPDELKAATSAFLLLNDCRDNGHLACLEMGLLLTKCGSGQ